MRPERLLVGFDPGGGAEQAAGSGRRKMTTREEEHQVGDLIRASDVGQYYRGVNVGPHVAEAKFRTAGTQYFTVRTDRDTESSSQSMADDLIAQARARLFP